MCIRDRYGSLFGKPGRVMDSCDQSVALGPDDRGEPLAWRLSLIHISEPTRPY